MEEQVSKYLGESSNWRETFVFTIHRKKVNDMLIANHDSLTLQMGVTVQTGSN